MMTFGLLLSMTLSLMAQKEKPVIRKGNDFYEAGKFTEAEVAYRKAIEIEGDTYEGSFNLGNALLKQKKYDESLQQLQVLAGTEKDKAKLSEIFHNLGNAYLESQKLEQSIAAYKSALRHNPADNETRYNLAYAQLLLKEQEEQEQNQDENKDQEKEEEEKKDQEQKDQEQKEQDQKEQEQEQQQQDQQQQDQKEQEQQNQQQQEKEVSKQMAEQLLKALEQDEKEIKEKVQLQKAKQAKSRKVEKDW